MKQRYALICLLLLGCQTDKADMPAAVALTAEATGYYCQMSLSEHAGPKGQIHLEGATAPIFFSQARDTLTYMMMPEQSHAITAAYVQDMSNTSWDNPGAWLVAKDAFYVVGSDATGGMGAPEFVPFASVSGAEAFIREHGGMIRHFDELRPADMLGDSAHEPGGHEESNDISQRLKILSKSEGKIQ